MYVIYVAAPSVLQNVALNMAAEQSSRPQSGAAKLATDGINNTCTITNTELHPWWRVDLVHLYTIWHVTVSNFEQIQRKCSINVVCRHMC